MAKNIFINQAEISHYLKDVRKIKVLTKEREKEFVALMLISGQIKLLNEISQSLNLSYSQFYTKIQDNYFD